jgi:hypothetical protein
MLEVDALGVVLLTAGILSAIALAILVGTLTAHLLFRASRGADDVADPGHKASS